MRRTVGFKFLSIFALCTVIFGMALFFTSRWIHRVDVTYDDMSTVLLPKEAKAGEIHELLHHLRIINLSHVASSSPASMARIETERREMVGALRGAMADFRLVAAPGREADAAAAAERAIEQFIRVTDTTIDLSRTGRKQEALAWVETKGTPFYEEAFARANELHELVRGEFRADMENVRSALGETIWKLSSIGGAGLILAVLLFLLATRRIVKPLEQLTGAAEALASGNYGENPGARIAYVVNSDDEVGHLTNAFARMDEALRRQFRQLDSLLEINAALSSRLDMRGVLGQVAEGGMALLQARDAWTFRWLGGNDIIQDVYLPAHEERIRIPITDPSTFFLKRVMDSVHPKVSRIGDVLPEVAVRIPNSPPTYAVGIRLTMKDKPVGAAVFRVDQPPSPYDLNLLEALSEHASVALENARLYFDLRKTYLRIVSSLAAAVEAKDAHTGGHCERLAGYGARLARILGLSPAEADIVRHASLLHDVGKIGIPDSILLKPGKLSDAEYAQIKQHPVIGANILRTSAATNSGPAVMEGGVIADPDQFLAEVANLIYNHHERYDGLGYPEGRAGEDIPFGARIIAVIDAYEAMTSDRPYRKAMSREAALAELRRCAGTQFDPRVVEAFIALIEQGDEYGETAAVERLREML